MDLGGIGALRWAAALLGVVAIFVPALSFTAPGIGARWSTFEIAASIRRTTRSNEAGARGQPSVGDVLRAVARSRRDWQQLTGRPAKPAPAAYRLAAALPIGLLVAGACAILALIANAGRWRRLLAGAAVIGALAAAFAITAAWFLERTLSLQIAAAVEHARHASPLLGLLGLSRLGAEVHIAAQAGAFLFLAAFLALLLLPGTRSHGAIA